MPRYVQGQIDWRRFRHDLRDYQQREALTGRDLARRLHVSSAALTRYSNGERTPTTEVFVYALLLMGRNITDYVPHLPAQAA